MKSKAMWLALGLSIVLNLVLAYPIVESKLNDPADRLGVLTRDIQIGEFGGSDVMFELPAGLTVRDYSPRGFEAIGQFEPYRFTIIVTTDDEALVNYNVNPDGLHRHQEYYSIELQEPVAESES